MKDIAGFHRHFIDCWKKFIISYCVVLFFCLFLVIPEIY